MRVHSNADTEKRDVDGHGRDGAPHTTLRGPIRAGPLEVMNAESRRQADRLIERLAKELSRRYPKAAACLRDDSTRTTAFYDFPKPHWKHLGIERFGLEGGLEA